MLLQWLLKLSNIVSVSLRVGLHVCSLKCNLDAYNKEISEKEARLKLTLLCKISESDNHASLSSRQESVKRATPPEYDNAKIIKKKMRFVALISYSPFILF